MTKMGKKGIIFPHTKNYNRTKKKNEELQMKGKKKRNITITGKNKIKIIQTYEYTSLESSSICTRIHPHNDHKPSSSSLLTAHHCYK